MRLNRHGPRFIDGLHRAINHQIGRSRFARALAKAGPRRLVIGPTGWLDRDWIPTDKRFLDLTNPATWLLHFPPNSIDAVLAEHVWEHLTAEEAGIACQTCFTYLKPGGYVRVAVPDGYHPDPVYQQWVKVGGAYAGQLSNGHKVLYTHETLVSLFESAGFRVELLEYFDSAGHFHRQPWDVAQGKIRRSERFYKRRYNVSDTSIVIDAFKPQQEIVRAPLSASTTVQSMMNRANDHAALRPSA
jgi:predicted SAM-dependent methyltransferase